MGERSSDNTNPRDYLRHLPRIDHVASIHVRGGCVTPGERNGGSPPGSKPAGQHFKRGLIEAALRDNEAIGARPCGPRDEPGARRVRRPRRVSPWSLLLLLPVAAAAALGYLELNRPPPDPPPAAEVDGAVQTPEIRFTGPPEAVDVSVFPLAVERIVLDPGHGGSSPGTAADGLTEKALALDIAYRLRNLLDDRYRVAMTRETDMNVALDRRTLIANRAGADVFVSIHVNWLPANRTCGVETYYLGPTDDPELSALAERENSEAQGYSLGDLPRFLEGLYAQARQDDSRALATAIQESLYGRLRAENPGLRDRGVKSAPFVVLIGAEMPAILAEVSCLSDAKEIERLRDESYLQAIAEALNAGIQSYAESLLPTAKLTGA
ncbi:MAG: N-acetylmuramoyl-L-alanine amidase [Holophagales bacterium]|nr:N-acetylmuramoyl-L-alanine amidase [Holophagales bacterium]MYH26687.1 N-acetylmuramoyl-L-alanine amidase [Holophagales bacterium]